MQHVSPSSVLPAYLNREQYGDGKKEEEGGEEKKKKRRKKEGTLPSTALPLLDWPLDVVQISAGQSLGPRWAANRGVDVKL